MSVINPTVGELIDRLSILNVRMRKKMQFGNSSRYMNEIREIHQYLSKKKEAFVLADKKDVDNQKSAEYENILVLINRLIWELIDITSDDSCTDQERILAQSFLVRANNQRHSIIDHINKRTGEFTGSEKE